MPSFDPFAAASLGIGELTLENGPERVAFYGILDLTRDITRLKLARELKAVLDAVMRYLEGARDLPDAVPAPKEPASVKNPFG